MRRLFAFLTFLVLAAGSAYADATYNGETISVTWSMADGADSKAVLSDRKTVMDNNWACGSNIAVVSSKSTQTYYGKTVTVFAPSISSGSTTGEMATGDYVEWTLTPYEGLTFTPTKVTFDAFKIGTNAPVMNIFVIDGDGEFHEVAAKEAMRRNNAGSTGEEEKEFTLTGIPASAGAVTLRVYVGECAYNKSFGIGNVVISGTVTGTSNYKEEYSIDIAPNNTEWGTVKSSKEYVIEGNPVTLTATPNRGYRFVNWVNAGGEVASTESEWTFVPEANVALTAVFEPLPVYTVSVTPNIEGAGTINITTFADNTYYEGDVLSIEARPATGYVFVDWSDEDTAWQHAEVTLTENLVLTANFESVGTPNVYANWPLAESTEAETNTDTDATVSTNYMNDSGEVYTYNGVSMRMYQPATDDEKAEKYITFRLNVAPTEDQVFVLRSVELDAARVGTSGGQFDIMAITDGNYNTVAEDLSIGNFNAGTDTPYEHYYYNLGQERRAYSYVDVRLTVKNVNIDKHIAFGNVKIQGYYKTVRQDVTIPYTGYATLSSTAALDFSGTGLKCYVAKVEDGDVKFTQVSRIPANTGVLLKGKRGTYKVNQTEDEVPAIEGNVLKAMTEAGSIEPTEGDQQNLVLRHMTTGLGFYALTSAYSLQANTAYLQLPASLGIDYVEAPYQLAAFAAYSSSSKTLRFGYQNVPLQGDTFRGETVTTVWSGDQVTATETAAPAWSSSAANSTKVVFEPEFASVRPTSLYQWFSGFAGLTSVEGLDNLNTTQVTNTAQMFNGCSSLPLIVVGDGWTLSQETESDGMFASCTALVGEDGSTISSGAATDASAAHTGAGGLLTKQAVTVTANEVDGDFWATYYKSNVNRIADDNTTVYTAARNGNTLKLSEVADRNIQAGQGVVLKSTTGTITLTTTDDEATGDFAANELKGVDRATAKGDISANNVYVLNNDANGLGFYLLSAEGTLEGNRAYLETTTSAPAYLIDFGGTTGVRNVERGQLNVEGACDLQGRRVNAQPAPGLYIVNGKKVVVK